MLNNDSHHHVVKTSEQWNERAVEFWIVPRGCLCIELTPSKKTKIKIGEGNKYYSQLPYVNGDGDFSEYYTKEEINNILENLNRMAIMSTDEYDSKSDLPSSGNKLGDVRFVKSASPSLKPDPDVYLWNGTKWIYVGYDFANIDLSDYVKKEEFNVVKDKVDEMYPKMHTHENKDILDQTEKPFKTVDKEKLDSLHNYDDTEIRQLIHDTGHTHTNKQILDTITTQSILSPEDREKFDSLHNYDDTEVVVRIETLEGAAHTHSNKDVLDQTTAPFKIADKEKLDSLEVYNVFVGTDGIYPGGKGLVPGPAVTDSGKFLSSSGEWLEVNTAPFMGATATTDGTSGSVPMPLAGQQLRFLRADGTWASVRNGDKYRAGDGIYILSGEVFSDTYPFKIYSRSSYLTQYIIYGTDAGVGEWDSGQNKFVINLSITADGETPMVQQILLDNKLYAGDYIDFERQIIVTAKQDMKDYVTLYNHPSYGTSGTYQWKTGSIGGNYYYNPGVTNNIAVTPGDRYWVKGFPDEYIYADNSYHCIFNANDQVTRYFAAKGAGPMIIEIQPGETYARFVGKPASSMVQPGFLYKLEPLTAPAVLPRISLFPGKINTINVTNTNKPAQIYVEAYSDEEADPDDPTSFFTGIIYNDGVLDVTQEDPNALNELTVHFRDDSKVLTLPEAEEMTGATASTDGTAGIVPAPLAGEQAKFLRGDGIWAKVKTGDKYRAGDGITILSGEVISDTFPFQILPQAEQVTQYIIYGAPGGVGDAVTGGYSVQINASAEGHTDRSATVIIPDKMYEGDYVDYKKQVYSTYRTNVTSRVSADPNYNYDWGIYSDGRVAKKDPGAYGGYPRVTALFELEPGASYEITAYNDHDHGRFENGMHINLYDADQNVTRTIAQSWNGNTTFTPAPTDKYMRFAYREDIWSWTAYGRQSVYQLKNIERPCGLPELFLYPGVVNTINATTTVKPSLMYIEVEPPDDPESEDPTSEFTGMIYNDGVLDITQEDPNALNELTVHFRESDKVITVPAGNTYTAGDGIDIDANDEISTKLGSGLQFDANGAIEVIGGGTYSEGDAIKFEYGPVVSGDAVTHVKWSLLQTRGQSYDCIQVREFEMRNIDNELISFKSNVTGVFVPSSTTPVYGTSQTPDALVDGTSRKMCCTNFTSSITEFIFTMEPTTPVPMNRIKDYRYITAEDEPNRDPISWVLYVSTDGTNYIEVDRRINQTITQSRSTGTSYYTPSFPSTLSTTINVQYGDGLEVDANNDLTVKLGSGLQFDANGAIEAPGGVEYVAGAGINIDYASYDPDYYFNTQVSCKLSGNRLVKTFTKYNSEPAFGAVIWHYNNEPFSGPVFVGRTVDSVKCTGNTTNVNGPITFDGKQWYYSTLDGWVDGQHTDDLGNMQTIEHLYPIAEKDDAALAILTAAYAGSNSKAISVKPATTTTIGGVIVGDGLSVDQNGEISVDEMVGATSSVNGTSGTVPAPLAGDNEKFLKGDGTWAEIQEGIIYDEGDAISITSLTPPFALSSETVTNTQYLFNTQVTAKVSSRTYTKYNTEPALGAIVYLDSYTQPYFVGLTADSVKYGTDYDSNIWPNPDHPSFTYLGVTWYYSGNAYGMPGNLTDSSGHMPKLSGSYSVSEAQLQALAKIIIDAAVVDTTQRQEYDINVRYNNGLEVDANNDLNVKLGTGLTFDNNDAITVDEMTGATALADGTSGTVPAPLTGDEGKYLRGDGTWAVVDAATNYVEGDAIEFSHPGMTDLGFDFDTFVSKFTPPNNGTVSVDSTNKAFTLTATGSDCYTNPWVSGSLYTIPVIGGRKYRLTWNSNASNVDGTIYAFENADTSHMHAVNQADQNYLEFTADTSSNVNFRFGVTNSGNSVTYSNIKFYEVDNADPDTNIINVKYGNGLSLDNSNRLQANTMTGADGTNAGTAGIVPAPAAGDQGKFLKGDGSWTSVVTVDEKVKNTYGTGNTYYPAGMTQSSTSTTTQVADLSFKFVGVTGETNVVGKAELTLGNSTASGTAGNKQGSLVIYGSTAYKHTISGAPTADRTLTLPNKTGTIALTSDLPTVNNNKLTLKGGTTSVTEFTANQSSDISFAILAGTNISVTPDATNHTVTIANTYTHPTYTARTGKPTGNVTINFDTTSSFTLSQVKSDGTGHVSDMIDRTVSFSLPSDIPRVPAAGSRHNYYLRDDGTWTDPMAEYDTLILNCTYDTTVT